MIIIAEAGINHNGSLIHAKRLIDKAKWAGADIVKFQTFFDTEEWADYEFSPVEWTKLAEYCKYKGITFASTAENNDYNAAWFLSTLNMPFFKMSSPTLTNKKFLRYVSAFDRPMLLSTGSIKHTNGMATIREVKKAIRWLKHKPIVLMHCVSQYPCEDGHYDRIFELSKLYPIVGLSDHTKDIEIPKASIVEKHIMLNNTECPDESVSLVPKEFKRMVKYLKQ